MTVGELIRHLQKLDKTMPVAIGYEYGDYYDTLVAEEIEEVFCSVTKTNSKYGKLEIIDDFGTPNHVILGRF
jgi:hypothetical protein